MSTGAARIVLVRHAAASGHDDVDPGLSPLGRAQASAVVPRLAALGVEEVWHGPRRRAVETATTVAAALAVPRRALDLLDDRTPVPSPARRGDYPPVLLERLDAVPTDERDVDGLRLAAGWTELVTAVGDRSVAVVTHAFVVGAFVATALGMPPDGWTRLPVSNTGIAVLEPDPARGARLRVFDDVAHLPPPSTEAGAPARA